MLNDIVAWFTRPILRDWNMWAAIGQMIGAIATLWTARIALGQTREASKQTKLAIQQMEDAREKEKEALKPDLKISASIEEENLSMISIYLTNIKTIPVHVYSYFITQQIIQNNNDEEVLDYVLDDLYKEDIKSDAPKTITFGDVYSIKIPVVSLMEAIKPHRQAIFGCHFFTTIGEIFTCSIIIKLLQRQDSEGDWHFHWTLDFAPEELNNNTENLELLFVSRASVLDIELEEYKKTKNPN